MAGMTEQEKYEAMWGRDSYRERSPGMRFLDDALAKLKMPAGATVLDIGCGTGRVSHALSKMGYNVTALDIAHNACTEFDGPFIVSPIWDIVQFPKPFDYGFCADVMEHLPTDKVDESLAAIARSCNVVYFQIANFVCHEGDAIGEPLHLTVKPCEWWDARLRKAFSQVKIVAMPKHHVAVCRV